MKNNNISNILDKFLTITIIGLLGFMTFSVLNNNSGLSANLLASINGKQHAAFNGVVTPVQKVPVWHKITQAKRYSDYSTFKANELQPLPQYNPKHLVINKSSLNLRSSNHLQIFEEKKTYSVPYCGNYTLSDNREYVGSHCAVDIVLPPRTPIRAMGNGIVKRKGNQQYGAGKYLVLMHNNFPSMDNPHKKETIYSSYSHLNEFKVNEGDIVKKGQIIGLSGNTGFSTGPHLHFQLDNGKSPYQPYWPFSYTEMNAAKLSFMGAVNSGLGMQNGMRYTISPMKYIYTFQTNDIVESSNTISKVFPAANIHGFIVESKEPVIMGEQMRLKIKPYDKSGNFVYVRKLDGHFKISSSNSNILHIQDKQVPATNLSRAVLGVNVNPKRTGDVKLTLKYINPKNNSNYTYTTNTFSVDKAEDHIQFVIVNDSTYFKDDKINFYLKTLNYKGELIENPKFNGKLVVKLRDDVGILNKTSLSQVDFNKGVAQVHLIKSFEGKSKLIASFKNKTVESNEFEIVDNSVRAEDLVVDAEGNILQGIKQKIKISALDENGKHMPNFDTPSEITVNIIKGDASISKHIVYADDFTSGIAEIEITPHTNEDITLSVTGYGLPTKQINIEPAIFTDISSTHKNYTAIKYLKEQGIVNGYSDNSFKPDNLVNRAEAMKLILEANYKNIPQTSRAGFNDAKVGDWFNRYVMFALNKDIIKGYEGNLYKPNQEVIKVEFLKMLLTTMEIEPDKAIRRKPFNDVPRRRWFAPYAKFALENNIVDDSKYLYPENKLTRAEVAQLIYNAIQYKNK